MKWRVVLFVASSIMLTACSKHVETKQTSSKPDPKIWVFAQFNVPEENNQLNSYWYYGRMSAALYSDISTNTTDSGFIRLTDIHYWGDDDAIHPYKDDEDEGEMLFRIEDLRKANRVKRPPNLPEQHDTIMEQIDTEETPIT